MPTKLIFTYYVYILLHDYAMLSTFEELFFCQACKITPTIRNAMKMNTNVTMPLNCIHRLKFLRKITMNKQNHKNHFVFCELQSAQ